MFGIFRPNYTQQLHLGEVDGFISSFQTSSNSVKTLRESNSKTFVKSYLLDDKHALASISAKGLSALLQKAYLDQIQQRIRRVNDLRRTKVLELLKSECDLSDIIAHYFIYLQKFCQSDEVIKSSLALSAYSNDVNNKLQLLQKTDLQDTLFDFSPFVNFNVINLTPHFEVMQTEFKKTKNFFLYVGADLDGNLRKDNLVSMLSALFEEQFGKQNPQNAREVYDIYRSVVKLIYDQYSSINEISVCVNETLSKVKLIIETDRFNGSAQVLNEFKRFLENQGQKLVFTKKQAFSVLAPQRKYVFSQALLHYIISSKNKGGLFSSKLLNVFSKHITDIILPSTSFSRLTYAISARPHADNGAWETVKRQKSMLVLSPQDYLARVLVILKEGIRCSGRNDNFRNDGLRRLEDVWVYNTAQVPVSEYGPISLTFAFNENSKFVVFPAHEADAGKEYQVFPFASHVNLQQVNVTLVSTTKDFKIDVLKSGGNWINPTHSTKSTMYAWLAEFEKLLINANISFTKTALHEGYV